MYMHYIQVFRRFLPHSFDLIPKCKQLGNENELYMHTYAINNVHIKSVHDILETVQIVRALHSSPLQSVTRLGCSLQSAVCTQCDRKRALSSAHLCTTHYSANDDFRCRQDRLDSRGIRNVLREFAPTITQPNALKCVFLTDYTGKQFAPNFTLSPCVQGFTQS